MVMFYYLLLVSIAAVFVVLLVGLGVFTREGRFNRLLSNRLMRLRIILQAAGVFLIVIYAIVLGG